MAKTEAEQTDITKSEAGLALQELLLANGALNYDALNKLLEQKGGLKLVASGIQEARKTRVGVQREWATADRTLTKEEKATIRQLPKVMGMAPGITSELEARAFTQDEIDLWAEEQIVERDATNMLTGLKDRMRSTMINVALFINGGPLDKDKTYEFKSPKHGFKFVVQAITGNVDYSNFKDIVDADVWDAITDEEVVVKTTVNEEKLTQALKDKKITMDQFVALVPNEVTYRVTPKAMKNGEDLSSA